MKSDNHSNIYKKPSTRTRKYEILNTVLNILAISGLIYFIFEGSFTIHTSSSFLTRVSRCEALLKA